MRFGTVKLKAVIEFALHFIDCHMPQMHAFAQQRASVAFNSSTLVLLACIDCVCLCIIAAVAISRIKRRKGKATQQAFTFHLFNFALLLTTLGNLPLALECVQLVAFVGLVRRAH